MTAVLFLAPGWAGADTDLYPQLLSGGPAEIVLDPSITYTLAGEAALNHTVSIRSSIPGTKATIQGMAGPIRASAPGISLTVQDCSFQSAGWSCLAATTQTLLTLRNCAIKSPGATGIYLANAEATLFDSTIDNCAFGVNSFLGSNVTLTNTTFTNCSNAYQQVGGTLTWNGGSLTGTAGTAVYLDGVAPRIDQVSIDSGVSGIQMQNARETFLSQLNVANCTYAYQQQGSILHWDTGNISGSKGTAIFLEGTSTTLRNLVVESGVYGIQAKSNPPMTLTDTTVSSCTFGYLQTGGALRWNGGGADKCDVAISFTNVPDVALTGISVAQYKVNTIGINCLGTTSGALHGVTLSGSSHAVQVHEGTLTVDGNSVLSCPYAENLGAGSGIASIAGANLTIRDTTFQGFQNAVDIQPATPKGTAVVENCTFDTPMVSSVSAVGAENVRMARCFVKNATHDGAYFDSSPAVIEDCVVTGSLNTGVTFWNCPSGTMRNCQVTDSGHQGIAVVNGSKSVGVFGNTILRSAITNVLADSTSTIRARGNIYAAAGAPNANIHLDGCPGATFESDLIIRSRYAMNAKQASVCTMTGCVIQDHEQGAILVYAGSHLTLNGVFFDNNDLSGQANLYSVFVNEGAVATARGCHLGIPGKNGLYNGATVASDASLCYWGSTTGPFVQWYGDGGTGAKVAWDHTNGSSVVFQPFLASGGMEREVNNAVSLSAGVEAVTTLGRATLRLTGKPGSATLTGQIAGYVRFLDVSHLASWQIPGGTYPGQVFSVWASYDLRRSAAQGSVTISAPEVQDGAGVALMRLGEDGGWQAMQDCSWVLGSHTMLFAPGDLNLLNGVFRLAQTTPVVREASARQWRMYE